MEDIQQKSKNILYAIVAILAIASITFKILNSTHFEQTSLLFVGIPTLITLLVIKNMGKPKNLYGIVFLVITLFLLLCSILFGEGIACIIFMAPIFYGVGALLVAIYKFFNPNENKTLKSVLFIPVFLFLLQPQGIKRNPKIHTIKTSFITEKKISLENLNFRPNFQEDLPGFFKMGFPKPINITGSGLKIGDKRIIQFKSETKGIGELILGIKEITSSKIKFEIVKDNTHINHWLTWKEIEVELVKHNNETEVIWKTNFSCDLGPQWYFEPLEKYAVNKMNQHLLHTFFSKQQN